MGRVVGMVAGAVGGLSFGRLISETAAFEDSMLGLSAVSSATASQMAELEKQARTLGATSMFSAQQAGDAQRFLAQAGFEVNEILSATPGILQLAAAGQMGLAQAADIASNALGGFGLEVDQLNRVNDVLAATASRSNTTIEQLGQALSFAAPFAASAGISIEEAAAAIGNMSDAGIQASRAGTGLVGVIRQLSNITSGSEEVLSQYGLTIADVNIEARGLEPVLETLRKANLNTASAIALFGSEAGAAAQVLVKDYSGAITDATGEAERMSLIIGSGLTGSMRSFSSMVSESMLQLGDSGLAGGFKAVTDNATGVLAVYNDMLPAFAEANDLTETQIQRIERLAGGIDLLKDAAILTAGVYGGRMVGALTAATGAKLAATRQAILYQAALARMAGVSATAAASQTALAAATRGAAGALALVGGPLGAAVIAMGAIYYFREELGLTQKAIGLTEQELADLRAEMKEMDGVEITQTLSQVENSLMQVGLKAAAAREELAQLRSESAGSGVLGFEGGRVGEEIRGMQAVAEYTEKMTELEQKRAAIAQESGSRAFKPLSGWLFEVADANETVTTTTTDSTKALRDAQREADRFASTLRSLEDRLFPVEAAHRSYRGEQLLLQTALTKGIIGIERYMDAWQRLEDAQLSGQNWQDAYGLDGSGTKELDRMNDAARDLGLTFESAFENAIIQGEGLREVLDGILQDVLRIAVRKSITEPLGGAIAGAFSSGFSSFTGGASSGGFMNQMFAEGGYTGSGSKHQPAGVVHAGEFVVQKSVVEKPGVRPALENLNRGYATGGYVGGGSGSGSITSPVTVNVYTPPGMQARTEERQDANGGRSIEVMIDEVTASNISNPGSRTGRAMQQRYGAQRVLTGRG